MPEIASMRIVAKPIIKVNNFYLKRDFIPRDRRLKHCSPRIAHPRQTKSKQIAYRHQAVTVLGAITSIDAKGGA
jgi:hypothetical protein